MQILKWDVVFGIFEDGENQHDMNELTLKMNSIISL